MLKTCKYCGRIVNENHKCNMKPKYEKNDKRIVDFRNSKEWKLKRDEIGNRDKHICRYCLDKKRICYDRIDVHHIDSLKEDWNKRLENNNLISLCRMCHEEAEAGKISKAELKQIISTPPHI